MGIFILLLGLVICAIAVTFLIKYYFLRAEITAIKITETSKIQALKNTGKEVAQELGNSGAWREQVEVKGYVVCDEPLTAQLSERPCVYFHTVINEEYEETKEETDEEGNTSTSTHQGIKTIANNKTQINFFLEDDTGIIEINPNRAESDGLTVFNNFEPNNRIFRGNYRIIGYHKTEKIIAVQSYIYVLGEINDSDRQFKISASRDKDKPFIISYKSEAELIDFKQSILKQKLSWGIGLFIFVLITSLIAVFNLI